jgi:hypothetical protein
MDTSNTDKRTVCEKPLDMKYAVILILLQKCSDSNYFNKEITLAPLHKYARQ